MSDVNKISTKNMLAWQAEDMVRMLDAWIQGRIVPNTIVPILHCKETVRVEVGISRIDLRDEGGQLWGFADHDKSKTHLQAIFEIGEDEYGTEEDIAECLDIVAEQFLEHDMCFSRHENPSDLRSYHMKMWWLCRYHEIETHDWSEWGSCVESAIQICVKAWDEGLLDEKITDVVNKMAEELVSDYDSIYDEDVYDFCCRILDVEYSDDYDSKLEFVKAAQDQNFIQLEEDDEWFSDVSDETSEVQGWRMDILQFLKEDEK